MDPSYVAGNIKEYIHFRTLNVKFSHNMFMVIVAILLLMVPKRNENIDPRTTFSMDIYSIIHDSK